ncbi:MAG TPA: 2Fe-2S iron-sulfur cluster-binding protein, partial [Spirochaetia bacterium]|nr:2Fe-2S iron-sulfur cluster-binding protein [Spirochaetia bacterium]
MPTIRIEPLGRAVEAQKGAILRDALHAAGILLDYPCGGAGRCRQCRVSVSGRGAAWSDALACQMVITEDCTVTVSENRLGAKAWKRDARNDDIMRGVAAPRPSLRRVRLEMPEPSLQDQKPDWERVEQALEAQGARPGAPDPGLLESVAASLRAGAGSGRITVDALCDERGLLRLDATRESALGFAVDLGTTTVDIALLDLETGKLLGRKTFLNRQVAFGADVISRAQSFHDKRGPVRDAGLATIRDGALEMLADAGQSARAVLK